MNTASTFRRIGIVGTGRVASTLGLALARHSETPMLVWGRDAARTQNLSGQIGQAQAAEDLASLVSGCDLVVLAVADDALPTVIAQMARQVLAHAPFVFHLSGKNGAAVLEPLRLAGAHVAAIHPAMTFTGMPEAELARMAGACFAMTAAGEVASGRAREVIGLLGGIALPVPEEQRVLYHAALCHAANHLVTLLAGSRKMLLAAGISEPQHVLAPLVRAALENSLIDGMAALSGPLLRGDRGTIANHLEALARDCPGQLPAYRSMARATLAELEHESHIMDIRLSTMLAE